jgi:hypothetical protein
MQELDRQFDYWNRIGPGKIFSHPVNFQRLSQWEGLSMLRIKTA